MKTSLFKNIAAETFDVYLLILPWSESPEGGRQKKQRVENEKEGKVGRGEGDSGLPRRRLLLLANQERAENILSVIRLVENLTRLTMLQSVNFDALKKSLQQFQQISKLPAIGETYQCKPPK